MRFKASTPLEELTFEPFSTLARRSFELKRSCNARRETKKSGMLFVSMPLV